jgi:short subunit dehydrogenase-like uncharacterized protein
MPTIAVLGAAGVVGSTLVGEAAARGHRVVPLVRDPDRSDPVLDAVRRSLAEADQGTGRVDPSRTVDGARVDTLAAALTDEVDLLVSAVGPAAVLGAGVLRTAVAQGVHLVDLGAAPGYLRWAHEDAAPDAIAAGVTVVPGAGCSPLLGDLLVAVAAEAVTTPSAAHVAYVLPGGGHLGDATPGVRASLAAGIGRPVLALVDGRLEEERTAEQRRLAWFPRPVGPHHAAAIPGGEPLTVPRHVPGVRTVRTYLAMPSWRAELAQFQANATRWDTARRRVVGRLERDRPSPSATRRAGLRWGVVAEVAGADGVARAWANGHDPYEVAAQAALAIAERIVAGTGAVSDPPVGVLAPAQVIDPRQLLDGCSAVTDLRWSIARPDDEARP